VGLLKNIESKKGTLEFEQIVQNNVVGLVEKNVGLEDCFNHSTIDSMFPDVVMIKQETARSVFIGQLKNGPKIFCKVYRERGLAAFLRRLLFKNRAQRAHARTLAFEKTEALTPRSLGYMTRRNGMLNVDSYHFCEYLDDGIALSELSDEALFSPARQLEVLAQLAVQLGEIHQNDYMHGDTKLSNFLYARSKLYFVDLDGFQRASRKKSPARDIARLIVALSEIGLENSELDQFVARYCHCTSKDRVLLLDQVRPLVTDFQRKHKVRYDRTPATIFLK